MIRPLLLLVWLSTIVWSADLEQARGRLQTAADQAAAALADGRQQVEVARRQRLAAQAESRARIAALRERLQRLEAEDAALAALPATSGDQARVLTAITRRLAGECPAVVDPRFDAAALQAAWPAVQAALDERLTRLAEACRFQRRSEAVLDRQGQERQLPVARWGAVQGVALGDDAAGRGLLRRIDDQRWLIAGPDLPASAGADLVPLDILGRLATREAVVGSLLERAGPFAWPILVVGLLGLLIIADRLWLWWRWHDPHDLPDRLIADLERDDDGSVAAHLARRTPQTTVLQAVVGAAAGDTSADPEQRRQRAGAALVAAEHRLLRGLRFLAVLAAVAPLLGLLGTVTGMITSFQALDLGAAGDQAGQLSAGIGEALLTTELGLIVAVPLLLAHAIFARDAQGRRARCESAAMQLLAHYGAAGDGSINHA